MTKRFQNFPELTSELAFDLIERLRSDEAIRVDFGASNQSCSRYVNVSVEDEDGDEIEEFKVRFSDHDDRHGSDITIRIDHLIETIEDDGEYIAVEIEDYRYEDALNAAVEATRKFITESR
jgi:hypothetical protein